MAGSSPRLSGLELDRYFEHRRELKDRHSSLGGEHWRADRFGQ
jgi:hypothetical protein